jgi:hypothetical protein
MPRIRFCSRTFVRLAHIGLPIESRQERPVNWEAIGAIAELVGAGGVIATLVYLAAQIRQNTISTRTQSYQAVVEALSHWSRSVGLDPSVATLLVQGNRDLGALPPAQRAQYTFLMVSLFRNYENIFYQHEQGAIDDVVFEGWKLRMRESLAAPGTRDWWDSGRLAYSTPFRAFLEQTEDDAARRRPAAP